MTKKHLIQMITRAGSEEESNYLKRCYYKPAEYDFDIHLYITTKTSEAMHYSANLEEKENKR